MGIAPQIKSRFSISATLPADVISHNQQTANCINDGLINVQDGLIDGQINLWASSSMSPVISREGHKSVATITDNHDTDPTLWQGNVSSYGPTLHLGYFLQHAAPKACNLDTKKLADPTQLFVMFLLSPLRGRISNGQGREKCNEAPTYQEFFQVKTDPKPTARNQKC